MKQLYIKWDKGLIVEIDSIDVTDSNTNGDSVDTEALYKDIFRLLRYSKKLVNRVYIKRISTDELELSLDFIPKKRSILQISDQDNNGSLELRHIGDALWLSTLNLYSSRYSTSIELNSTLDTDQESINSTAHIMIDNIEIAATISSSSSRSILKAHSIKNFSSTDPIVRHLPLDTQITSWFNKQIVHASIDLRNLELQYEHKDPQSVLSSLQAEAILSDVSYLFAKDFEPAYAKEVVVRFTDSSLYVTPKNSTFYTHNAGSPEIKIEFAKEPYILDVHLLLNARLDKHLHRLIASYGIDLPLLQLSGTTETKLDLKIDLDSLDTEAKGKFITNGLVSLGGLDVWVKNSTAHLEGSDIALNIEEILLFDNNLTASVSGHINPENSSGKLRFDISKAQHFFGTTKLYLKSTNSILTYIFDQDGDKIELESSIWGFLDKDIVIDAFIADIDLETLKLDLPPTKIVYDQKSIFNANGSIMLKEPSFKLNARVIQLDIAGFTKGSDNINLDVNFEQNLTITSSKSSRWLIEDIEVVLDPFVATIDSDGLYIDSIKMRAGDFLDADVKTDIEFETNSAKLDITNFVFTNRQIGKLFDKQESIKVFIIPTKESEYEVIAPSLYLSYTTIDDGWKAHFYRIDALSDLSELMREYDLIQGSFTLYSPTSTAPYYFEGVVDYPYALTMQDSKAVWQYNFTGSMAADSTINLRVNETVQIKIDDRVEINSSNIAYNLPEMRRFYTDHQSKSSSIDNNSTPLDIDIISTKSAIHFDKQRKALADKIEIKYRNNRLQAQLIKADGTAMLKVIDDQFHLKGDGFDDEFMDNIFLLSDFNDGSFSFDLYGATDNFSGIAKIEKTTVYDFVVLNNIFAFFNTIPALITFSSPSYKTDGIYIKEAYTKLDFQDNNLSLTNITTITDEMSFSGDGYVDYDTELMSVELSVKIKAAENLRKIPLIGYILAGDDNSELTTIQITGDIKDPTISSLLAKDMIATPFNILKRTINFPLHYFEKFQDSQKKE